MSEKRFPIQGAPCRREGALPGLLVPWEVAEMAYSVYVRLFGQGQSLERLAERGGFGREEFLALLARRSPVDYSEVEVDQPTRLAARLAQDEAEVERLRAGLREIERGLDVFVEGCYSYRAIRPYRDQARALLEKKV